MSQPIVVGFDGSERSHDALALARELAPVLGADLIVVNAYTPEERLWSPGTAPLRAQEELRDIAATAEAELAEMSERHEIRAVSSPSAAGALHATAESEDAQLIVVGSSRHGAVGRALLGTVTHAVLDAAPCAVVVAPSGLAETPPRLARIGVGFDDTPEAHDALAVAGSLAARTDGSVSILWAAHLVARALPHAFAGYLEPNYFEKVRGEIEERLERAAAELGGEVRVRTEIASGDTAEALVEHTRNLDLLVLGSRGYGPVKRVLLGSVSHDVVNRAHCPVLVIGRGSGSLAGATSSTESAAAAG